MKLSSETPGSRWQKTVDYALDNKREVGADIRVNGDEIATQSKGFRATKGGFASIKAFFTSFRRPISDRAQTLDHLRSDFSAHFREQVIKMSQEIGVERSDSRYSELSTASSEVADKILGDILSDAKAGLLRESTKVLIARAHRDSLFALTKLRATFAKPEYAPEFVKVETFVDANGKRLENPKVGWAVIRPAPNPQKMAFRGGGAKGVGYIGMLRAMDAHGVLPKLRKVAGSSAGALTASLIASGMNVRQIKRFLDKTPLDEFTDQAISQHIREDTRFVGLSGWYHGTRATEVLHYVTRASVVLYLEENLNKETSPLKNRLKDHELEKLAKLLEDKNNYVTFAHLRILHKADPAKFKELTLTGFNTTTQQEEYYDADSKPDMPIAHAARISMAIPKIFKAIQKEDGSKLVDGGVGSNLPVEVFVKTNVAKVPSPLMDKFPQKVRTSVARKNPVQPVSPEEQHASAKTWVLGFDEKGKFYRVSHHGNIYSPDSWLRRALSGNKNLNLRNAEDGIKQYSAGPNALLVAHGDLETTTFDASNERLKEAQLQAEIRGLEQLNLRQNQATYEKFNSLDAAIMSLKSFENHELEAIVASSEDAFPPGVYQAAKGELGLRGQRLIDQTGIYA